MKLTTEHILPYLDSHTLVQVATWAEEHPWIASVYYTSDKDLNIYFLSDPDTLHCKQIAKNPRVSAAITDTDQEAPLKGLQLWGEAYQITDAAKIRHCLSMWKKTLNVTDSLFSYENMIKKVLKGRMYCIAPKKIKFFNQELFDVEDGKEPVLEL